MPSLSNPDKLFFPVKTTNVYVPVGWDDDDDGLQLPPERAGGWLGRDLRSEVRFVRVPGKKAVVNADTGQPISVVSSHYGLLTNTEAVRYASECCKAAFPSADEKHWQISEACASPGMGSCSIRLDYDLPALDFELELGSGRTERYKPYVSLANSYNGTRALRLEIGFVRIICTNGLIFRKSQVRLRFPHFGNLSYREIARQINPEQYQRLQEGFREYLKPLSGCDFPVKLFLPVLQHSLRIREPKRMSENSRCEWAQCESWLSSVCRRYADELGENAYALLNSMTELASRGMPRQEFNKFARCEPRTYQRRAGEWLGSFSEQCTNRDFSASEYVRNLQLEASVPSMN